MKITTVNPIITNEKGEILVVKDEEGTYLLPGGKIEEGEDEEVALFRETYEELNIDIKKFRFFKSYSFEKAFTKDLPLEMRIYIVEYDGEIEIGSEITEILWLNKQNYSDGNKFPKEWWNPIFSDLQASGIISNIL